jgi:hypothetical protein
MADDWKKRIIEQDAAIPEWKRRAMANDPIVNIFDEPNGPDPNNIDDSVEAPNYIRLQVGALDKPEDRLKALQRTYPDAVPYGDNNFLFTGKDGKTHPYNRESWIPSMGDFASIAPEAAEALGGFAGGVMGGVGGAALGSSVPVVGSTAGGFAGAMTGAGLLGTATKEATQRGLNYLFQNEDTRTTGQQLTDAATTFGLNAAGEGVGRLAAKGVQAGKEAWVRKAIGGAADDPAKAAERLADWQAIGVDPTTGMVNGQNKSSLLEHALIPTRSGNEIDKRIADAFTAQGNEFGRIVSGISDKPLSVAEAGEALQKQAQAAKNAQIAKADELYVEAGKKITSPARVDATSTFLSDLQANRAGYGEFDKLTKGSQTDSVLNIAKSIVTDAQKGMTFDSLKAARTHVGQLAADTEDRVLKNQLDGLYASLTSDMEKTAVASGDDALSSFKTANDHFKQYIDPVTGFGKGSEADTILKKNTDDILNWTMSGGKNGGNKIASVRRTMLKADGGQEAWNGVTSGVIDRLGRGSDDAFDPGTFMRNWNKISPEAKGAMFDGTANKQFKEDLDRLARISDNWGKYRKNANHSNTESHRSIKESLSPLSGENAMLTILGSAVTGNPVIGAAMGMAKGAAKAVATRGYRGYRAKLLTNPEVVNWAANLPKSELQKGGVKGHLAKLYQMGKDTSDNALSAAIDDYLKDLKYENEE